MYNHAPKNYQCPICFGVAKIENEHTLLKSADLVYQDDGVSAFINSFYIKNNPGHVIVVPNDHFENIYDLPADIGLQIYSVAQKIAIAMKNTYRCDGITILQNNEPASSQHAFHYHMHVFPRYENDLLHENMSNKQLLDPNKRAKYAQKLKECL